MAAAWLEHDVVSEASPDASDPVHVSTTKNEEDSIPSAGDAAERAGCSVPLFAAPSSTEAVDTAVSSEDIAKPRLCYRRPADFYGLSDEDEDLPPKTSNLLEQMTSSASPPEATETTTRKGEPSGDIDEPINTPQKLIPADTSVDAAAQKSGDCVGSTTPPRPCPYTDVRLQASGDQLWSNYRRKGGGGKPSTSSGMVSRSKGSLWNSRFAWSLKLSRDGATLDMRLEGVNLSETETRRWCDWAEEAIPAFVSEHQLVLRREAIGRGVMVVAREVNLASTGLGDVGLHLILALLCRLCVGIRVLRLSENRLGRAGALSVAAWIDSCPHVPLWELYLSRNFIPSEGVEAILEAVGRSPAYPADRQSNNKVPLWLRVDNNIITAPEVLVQNANQYLSTARASGNNDALVCHVREGNSGPCRANCCEKCLGGGECPLVHLTYSLHQQEPSVQVPPEAKAWDETPEVGRWSFQSIVRDNPVTAGYKPPPPPPPPFAHQLGHHVSPAVQESHAAVASASAGPAAAKAGAVSEVCSDHPQSLASEAVGHAASKNSAQALHCFDFQRGLCSREHCRFRHEVARGRSQPRTASRARRSASAPRGANPRVRRPDGLRQSLESVGDSALLGTLAQWNRGHGWIDPDHPIDHPAASLHRGQLFVSKLDCSEADFIIGTRVSFKLYVDNNGLGAEAITALDVGQEPVTLI